MVLPKADNASTKSTYVSLNEVLSRLSAAPGYDVRIVADKCCLGYTYCKSSFGAVQVLIRHQDSVTASSKVSRRAGTRASCLHKTG